MRAATTRFIAISGLVSFSGASRFQLLSHELGTMLHQGLMFRGESSGEVTIDIELTHYVSMGKYGNHNLRFRFQRTRQVARIFADIVHDYGLSARSRSAADALIEWNASVRRHRALESAKDENRRLCPGLQHIESHPVVLQHTVGKNL